MKQLTEAASAGGAVGLTEAVSVFITREYRQGGDTGELRVYASLEGAQRSVEGRFPVRDRFRWRQYAPGKWLGRIVGDWQSYSAYVDELPVEEGGS